MRDAGRRQKRQQEQRCDALGGSHVVYGLVRNRSLERCLRGVKRLRQRFDPRYSSFSPSGARPLVKATESSPILAALRQSNGRRLRDDGGPGRASGRRRASSPTPRRARRSAAAAWSSVAPVVATSSTSKHPPAAERRRGAPAAKGPPQVRLPLRPLEPRLRRCRPGAPQGLDQRHARVAWPAVGRSARPGCSHAASVAASAAAPGTTASAWRRSPPSRCQISSARCAPRKSRRPNLRAWTTCSSGGS